MINIGINYLKEENDKGVGKYDNIYKELIKRGYIDTLKFPGRYCDIDNLKRFISFIEKVNCKADLHGLPGMVPATHEKNFLKGVNWKQLGDCFEKTNKIERISTHIGLDGKDKLSNYNVSELKSNFNINFIEMKQKMKEMLNKDVFFGGENQPGGFGIDKITIAPVFVSKIWGKMDFGVFDISHAKYSAKELKMSYDCYLKSLYNTEKVKIIHISGNIDRTNKLNNKVDKHMLISNIEIKDIIESIKIFSNLDLIISEYAYCSKYSYEKEIVIEVMMLNNIVKYLNYEKANKTLIYLESNLKNDVSNLDEILKYIE